MKKLILSLFLIILFLFQLQSYPQEQTRFEFHQEGRRAMQIMQRYNDLIESDKAIYGDIHFNHFGFYKVDTNIGEDTASVVCVDGKLKLSTPDIDIMEQFLTI